MCLCRVQTYSQLGTRLEPSLGYTPFAIETSLVRILRSYRHLQFHTIVSDPNPHASPALISLTETDTESCSPPHRIELSHFRHMACHKPSEEMSQPSSQRRFHKSIYLFTISEEYYDRFSFAYCVANSTPIRGYPEQYSAHMSVVISTLVIFFTVKVREVEESERHPV